MKNKTITWGLAVIVISLIAAFFISQNYIIDRGKRMEGKLSNIAQAVKQNDWAEAQNYLQEFDNIWTGNKHIFALNNAEQDYSDMSDAIENLRGAIESKDSHKAIQIARQIEGHWKNFRKLIPEP